MRSSAANAQSLDDVDRASQSITFDAWWAEASHKSGVGGRISSVGWQVCQPPNLQRRWQTLRPIGPASRVAAVRVSNSSLAHLQGDLGCHGRYKSRHTHSEKQMLGIFQKAQYHSFSHVCESRGCLYTIVLFVSQQCYFLRNCCSNARTEVSQYSHNSKVGSPETDRQDTQV